MIVYNSNYFRIVYQSVNAKLCVVESHSKQSNFERNYSSSGTDEIKKIKIKHKQIILVNS